MKARNCDAIAVDLEDLKSCIEVAEKLEIPVRDLEEPHQACKQLMERLNLVNLI